EGRSGQRRWSVTGVQTCALPISGSPRPLPWRAAGRFALSHRRGASTNGLAPFGLSSEYRLEHFSTRIARHQVFSDGDELRHFEEIGRASCRGRGEIAGGARAVHI